MRNSVIMRAAAVLTLLVGGAGLLWANQGHQNTEEMRAKRLEHLTKELGLTTDQTAQVKTILDEQWAKKEALKTKEEKMAAMQETDTRINAVLNPDQQMKFKEMKAKHAEKMKEHHSEMHKAGMEPAGAK